MLLVARWLLFWKYWLSLCRETERKLLFFFFHHCTSSQEDDEDEDDYAEEEEEGEWSIMGYLCSCGSTLHSEVLIGENPVGLIWLVGCVSVQRTRRAFRDRRGREMWTTKATMTMTMKTTSSPAAGCLRVVLSCFCPSQSTSGPDLQTTTTTATGTAAAAGPAWSEFVSVQKRISHLYF